MDKLIYYGYNVCDINAINFYANMLPLGEKRPHIKITSRNIENGTLTYKLDTSELKWSNLNFDEKFRVLIPPMGVATIAATMVFGALKRSMNKKISNT